MMRTIPGLVQQRGPGKRNFPIYVQTEPWQGGGVAGGGQARTGHGNWFMSVLPRTIASRGTVILPQTKIVGEVGQGRLARIKRKRFKGGQKPGAGGIGGPPGTSDIGTQTGFSPDGMKPIKKEPVKPEPTFYDAEEPESEFYNAEEPESEFYDAEEPILDDPSSYSTKTLAPNTVEDILEEQQQRLDNTPEGEFYDAEEPEGEFYDAEEPEGEFYDAEEPKQKRQKNDQRPQQKMNDQRPEMIEIKNWTPLPHYPRTISWDEISSRDGSSPQTPSPFNPYLPLARDIGTQMSPTSSTENITQIRPSTQRPNLSDSSFENVNIRPDPKFVTMTKEEFEKEIDETDGILKYFIKSLNNAEAMGEKLTAESQQNKMLIDADQRVMRRLLLLLGAQPELIPDFINPTQFEEYMMGTGLEMFNRLKGLENQLRDQGRINEVSAEFARDYEEYLNLREKVYNTVKYERGTQTSPQTSPSRTSPSGSVVFSNNDTIMTETNPIVGTSNNRPRRSRRQRQPVNYAGQQNSGDSSGSNYSPTDEKPSRRKKGKSKK
jgi:hypothetical protein